MTTNEENNMLQEIGEKNLRIIRQVAAGMNLGNIEGSSYPSPQRRRKKREGRRSKKSVSYSTN